MSHATPLQPSAHSHTAATSVRFHGQPALPGHFTHQPWPEQWSGHVGSLPSSHAAPE